MPVNTLGPVNMVAQSMAMGAGTQSMFEGGMAMRAQGMDGRKKSAGLSGVTFVSGNTGKFSGSTFVFTAVNANVGDWVFVIISGQSPSSVTGGSGNAWTKVVLNNAGARPTTLFYRALATGDAGAPFTINDGINNAGVEWVAYRGIASVGSPQTQVTLANAPTLVFTAPTLANRPSRLLAILSAQTNSLPTGDWTAPAIWTPRVVRNYIGPKFLGDTLSSAYQQAGGGSITFTMPGTQADGQVGWLFELVGN